ncbi:MAG: DUF2442 domain-containing protein [Rhizobiaceae bacterium]|jgi:hypothetical protein|nr:DUF2442 domain-containing protein [Rhizobiaceae bacterium]
MKRYRIIDVRVATYPVLHLTFDDGLEGDYDIGPFIERGPMFAPLKDRALFEAVAIGGNGRWFGWNLDHEGEEIDFSTDGARADIERQNVEEMARRYRESRIAAAE